MESKKKDNNKKEKKFDIKEIFTDEKKRARLILFIYLIFFIVLIVGMRSNTSYKDDDTARIINNQADEKLAMNNYEFTYTITKGEKKYVYKGKHYNEKELFTYNGKEYYKEENLFLKKSNKDWVKTDNPYVEYEYLQLSKLDEILAKSDFISQTKYNDSSIMNSYKMYVDGMVTDNVMEITSKDDKLIKIELKFENMHILMEYDNVGNVVNFDI